MTPEEALEKLKDLNNRGSDPKASHVEADGILCSLLSSMGYEEIVEVFKDIDKWYA
jgi:hypothetical protein